MAGYVPESTKEVQALIVKSYADTVLNAFLTAPELVAVAPVGSRAGYETQLSMLAEQEEKTRQERRNFVSLCEAALTEGELCRDTSGTGDLKIPMSDGWKKRFRCLKQGCR